jgi:hypothetical protein
MNSVSNEIKYKIYWTCDPQSQHTLRLVDANFNTWHKEAIAKQKNYIDTLISNENKTKEFNELIKNQSFSACYVRNSLCTFLNISNTEENNKQIFRNLYSIKMNFLSDAIESRHDLAIYLYIKQQIDDDLIMAAILETIKNSYSNDLKLLTATEQHSQALVWFAAERLPRMVELLLTIPDIDVNAKNEYDASALFYAAYDNIEIVKLLLAVPKIDVNITCDGTTALAFAIQEGHNEIVELLKNAGAK